MILPKKNKHIKEEIKELEDILKKDMEEFIDKKVKELPIMEKEEKSTFYKIWEIVAVIFAVFIGLLYQVLGTLDGRFNQFEMILFIILDVVIVVMWFERCEDK